MDMKIYEVMQKEYYVETVIKKALQGRHVHACLLCVAMLFFTAFPPPVESTPGAVTFYQQQNA